MKTKTIRQSSFSIGEVDVVNYNRTDLEDYLKAAQKLLNIEITSTGTAKKRKGTKAVINVNSYAENNTNGYEFIDKNGNHYAVISSNLNLHIFTVIGDIVEFYQSVSVSYTLNDLKSLDYTQENDSIVFTSGKFKPSRLYVTSYSPVVFAFEELNIYPFPAIDFGLINYDPFTASLTGNPTNVTLEFTGLASDPGFTTAWVGGQIIGGGATVDDPIGYAIITSVTPWDGSKVVFVGSVQVPFKIAESSIKGIDYIVKQPAWSNDLGWPKKVCLYQNRLWLGNSDALRSHVFGSQINKPINFDVGTGEDIDAIEYSIGQTDTGGITWINAGKQLEVYTQNFNFVCPQDVNTALTPTTFSIRQQDAYGSSNNFKPINYINDSYYVAKTGNSFIDFKFDGVGQAYTASNISIASSHLIKKPINRAIMRGSDSSQDNLVYILNNDHTITAFQFAKQVGLGAFTPIEFEQDNEGNPTVEVIDIFAINNQIYMIKKYTLNGNYVLEKFVEDVKIDSYIDSTMDETGLITGLNELEGYTVIVVYDQQDYGEYFVEGGKIIAFNPNNFTGPVKVGLLYPVEIIPMYLFAGAAHTSSIKAITEINVDYYKSINFFVNTTQVPYQTYEDIQAQLPPQPQTGTATIRPVTGYNKYPTISISQNSPFDLEITGIDYNIIAHRLS